MFQQSHSKHKAGFGETTVRKIGAAERIKSIQHQRSVSRSNYRRSIAKGSRTRHSPREPAPQGYSRGIAAIPRNSKRVVIWLPQTLSLRDNFAGTVNIITQIRDAVLKRNTPVMLRFDDVVSIEPAATLMLAAEIDRCRRLRTIAGGLVVNGNYPQDTDLFLQLREMGFYRIIGVPDREEIPDERETANRPRFLRFFSFNDVQSEVAASVTDLVSVGAFSMSDQLKRRMTGAVKEAMGNAVEHAYSQPGQLPALLGRWWCAVYVHPVDSEMMIILFDQGVGVPGTLDANLFDLIRSIVARNWGVSDGYMIAAATDLYRTSTGQAGRGRGFRDMKRFIDSCDDGELRIVSNGGSYRSMKGFEAIDDEPISIGGTLVEWRVKHSKTADFEDA